MASNLVEYILSVDSKGAVTGLKQVETEAKKTETQLDKTGKQGEKSGDRMKGAFKKIGIAAAAGTAAIAAAGFAVIKLAGAAKDFTKEAVDMINDLGDIGNRSGVAADTIGALKAAFHASGQEAGAVNSVLDIVAKRFGALSRGSKRAEESFKKYGIATRDLEGRLRSNNDMLLDAMHIIENLEDTSLRSRAAVELFGVGGQQLSQALGAGNFDKFLEFVNEFGAVAGPKAAKSAALVQDSISLSGIAFEGLREEIVLSLGTMGAYQSALNAQMAAFAGLKAVVESQSETLKRFAKAAASIFAGLAQSISVFFVRILQGVESSEKGLQGFLENIFKISAAITRHLIKPLILATGAASGVAEALGQEELADSTAEATAALILFHKSIDPEENRGFLTFQKFSTGVAKSLKTFREITASTTKQTLHFGDGLEEAGEAAEQTAQKIDYLAESASILNAILTKLGVPKALQFRGIKEATAQVEALGGGLAQLGAQGRLGDSKFLREQGIASFDQMGMIFGQGLMMIAPQIGAIIAVTSGLVQLAEKLGQMGENIQEIKNSLTASVQERAQVIERGLQSLPTILNDVLPHIIQVMADAIIFGFAKAIAEQINRLITAFNQIFTKEGRQQLRQERGAGVTLGDRINEFIRRIGVFGDIAFEGMFRGMRAGGRIPSARSGLNFTGENAGLALLHKNEFVVPESGQAPQSVKRAMGSMGGSVNLVINAQVVEQNAVDELVRQIERRFRTFGQSTSPLFGS